MKVDKLSRLRLKTGIFLLIITVGLTTSYHFYSSAADLEAKNTNLQNKIVAIEKEAHINNLNRDTMCYPTNNAVPQYVDCGASFSPRWATCVCTTLCLEDYAMSYSNRDMSTCKDWNAPQKIKVEPAADEDEDDDEGDEDDGR